MSEHQLANEVSRRVQFLRVLLDSNREAPQKFIQDELKKKFGKGLSFADIKKLREAHAKGKFSEAAVPSFTRQLQREAKAPAKRKTTAKKAAAKPAAAPAAPAAPKAKQSRAKKSRGERREKVVRRGRRKADKRFVDMSEPSNHLVLVMIEGGVEPNHFKNKKDAQEFINSAISGGVNPTKVTYYQRSEIGYSVQL
ncbi:MAG: hypothetical protein KDB07_04810 [Planctomycetes bacterium]|nr:hypothetical protein [Planctomycetota bacterium]